MKTSAFERRWLRMAHGFVTELVAEKPRVFLIVKASRMVEALAGWSKDVQLEIIKPTEVQSQASKFSTAYRVIWVATEVAELPSQAESQLLHHLGNQVVLVVPVSTLTQDTRPLFSSWTAVSREIEHKIAEIREQLPQASWIVGLDAFTSSQPAPILQTMTALLSKNTWLDPQVDFYPQTWSAFLQNVPILATHPRQFQKIVRGRKLHTSTLIKMLKLHYQRFVGQETVIESLEVATSPSWDWPSTTSVKVESAEELVQVILPTLQPQSTVATTVSRMTNPVVSVTSESLTPEPLLRRSVAIPPRTPIKQPQTHLAQGLAAKVNAAPQAESIKLASQITPEPDKHLDDKLAALFQDYRSERKVEQVKEVAQATTQTKKKSLRKKKFFWAGLVLIIMALTIGAGVGVLSIASHQLKQILLTNFADPQTETHLQTTSRLTFWYQLAKFHQQALSFLPGTQIVESGQLVQASDAFLKFQTSAAALEHSSVNLVLAVTGRFPVDTNALLTKLNSQSQETFTHLSAAQLYFKNLSQYQGEAEKKQFLALEDRLNDQKRAFVPLQQLQPFLPSLLGVDIKKTYALLLQNHQELRPTGGVIQAVAFVTFDKGQLVDTQVVSASSIVPATSSPTVPPDMAQLLGVTELRLADSSWSPDAPASADQTIAFLEQATTKNIDGVVFVNTLDLVQWLQAVGPLELTEYQETVTAQNLLERLEAHSERQLVGNVQNDYAATLLTRLLQKTMITPQEKIPQLLSVFYQLLESKQMALVVKEEATATILRELGWSGNLIEPACPPALQQDRCTVDVLAQAESNIGSNKANIYLNRRVSHGVSLLPDGIQHRHTIVYNNRSTSNAWPRGSYKAYIRLYVSPTARLEGITINGQNLPAGQQVLAFENNRQVFGAVIEVPIQQELTLEYQYLQPSQQLSPFSYALFTQFQPGIEVPEYEVSVNTGEFQASLVAPQATINGSTVVFRSPTTLQSLVGVRF